MSVRCEDCGAVASYGQELGHKSDCPRRIVDHKTFSTGEICHETGFPVLRHEPLTAAEGDAMWAHAKQIEAERAERMPDEKTAISALWDAYQRLKELGWNDPSYCPKDGTRFKVIELGSTGIFDCSYSGEWPKGHYMVEDEHDIYPTSTGVAMYRLYPEDEEKRKRKMAAAVTRFKAEMEAEDREPRTAASSLD
jgi:hypothetical protein